MKFNLKNVKRIVAVGVASLALIVPLVGSNANSVSASAYHPMSYYRKCMNSDDFLDYATLGDDEPADTIRMKLLIKHPSLKHMLAAKYTLEDSSDSWENEDWSFYAHHYKQLYSPYLRRVMPSYEPANCYHGRYNTYLIHKAQRQMGLLGHHRGKRTYHIKRHKVNHHKRTHRHAKRNVRRRKHHSRKGHHMQLTREAKYIGNID